MQRRRVARLQNFRASVAEIPPIVFMYHRYLEPNMFFFVNKSVHGLSVAGGVGFEPIT